MRMCVDCLKESEWCSPLDALLFLQFIGKDLTMYSQHPTFFVKDKEKQKVALTPAVSPFTARLSPV